MEEEEEIFECPRCKDLGDVHYDQFGGLICECCGYDSNSYQYEDLMYKDYNEDED